MKRAVLGLGAPIIALAQQSALQAGGESAPGSNIWEYSFLSSLD